MLEQRPPVRPHSRAARRDHGRSRTSLGTWLPYVLPLAGLLFALVWGRGPADAVLWPLETASYQVDAACGASSSSCKTCHETRGTMPVSHLGDWHEDHAFGDFCEFCHGGVVTETTASAAHQGMWQPMADPGTSCATCHVTELNARVGVYATALGITPGGSGPGGAPAAGSEGTPAPHTAAGSSADPAAGSAADEGAAGGVEAGGRSDVAMVPLPIAGDVDLIDFRLPPGPDRISLGNLLLVILNLLAAAGLGTYGYLRWRERRWRGRAQRLEMGIAGVDAAARDTDSRGSAGANLRPDGTSGNGNTPFQRDPDLLPLARLLTRAEPQTLRALEALLERGEEGERLLRRVAGLDPEVMERVRSLPLDELALLLTLARVKEVS